NQGHVTMEPIYVFFSIVAIIVALVIGFPFLYFFGIYLRALASNANVSIMNLIGMKLRRVPPALIVEALIRVKKAGLDDIDTNSLEAHYLAGGDILSVVNALIAADKAGIALNFKKA